MFKPLNPLSSQRVTPQSTKPLALPPGDPSLPNKGKLPKPEKSVTIRNGCSLFKGKTPAQVEQMFIDKGFIKLGERTYRNPKTQRQYFIDSEKKATRDKNKAGKIIRGDKGKVYELPHVDIHHFRVDSNGEPIIRNGVKLPDIERKVKIPLTDNLFEKR
jgi:hypothetical protein